MAEDRAYLNGQLVMDSKQDLVDEIEQLRAELKNLVECLDLAARNNDLPLPFVGEGAIHIEKAREALGRG